MRGGGSAAEMWLPSCKTSTTDGDPNRQKKKLKTARCWVLRLRHFVNLRNGKSTDRLRHCCSSFSTKRTAASGLSRARYSRMSWRFLFASGEKWPRSLGTASKLIRLPPQLRNDFGRSNTRPGINARLNIGFPITATAFGTFRRTIVRFQGPRRQAGRHRSTIPRECSSSCCKEAKNTLRWPSAPTEKTANADFLRYLRFHLPPYFVASGRKNRFTQSPSEFHSGRVDEAIGSRPETTTCLTLSRTLSPFARITTSRLLASIKSTENRPISALFSMVGLPASAIEEQQTSAATPNNYRNCKNNVNVPRASANYRLGTNS
jgi:hypothetical protein